VLLWHLASVTFLFRWIFRDPIVDVRFLAVGAVLPDLIDLTAATILGVAHAELWGHSLVVPTVAAVVVMASTRRGRRRRAWMALIVAWLLHLVVDGMWLDAEVLFWPVFGLDIVGETGLPFWELAWQRAVSDPWRWVLEAIGLAYLVWLAVATDLRRPEVRRRILQTGRLS